MKALFTSVFARRTRLLAGILFTLAPLVYPEVMLPQVALASNSQTGENQPLIFEIKDPSLIQKSQIPSLSFQTLVENDPLVTNLRTYLKDHNSPLAEYASEIVKQPQWQRALAISWVESNFGQHCYDNNCSGIGVQPGHPAWRKYKTKLDWFVDMSQLLEKPIYKERYTTFEKMRGVYVYPGSNAWVYGAKTKYAELMAITKDAQEQQLAQSNNSLATASNSLNLELAFTK